MRKTSKTRQALAESELVWAQGKPATASKGSHQFVREQPTLLSHGMGSHVYDLDGNKYLDFICGLGTNILGHSHPKVTNAVKREIAMGGPSFSLPSELEKIVAELICDRFHVERVRFLKTGNEATLAAIRIARAFYSNQRRYVISEGYHGHGDIWTSLTPPAHGVVENYKVANMGDAVLWDDVSAWITEPIKLDASEERKRTVKGLMAAMSDHGTAVIFDEVITGLRVPRGSVSKWWGMTPTISIFGKAMANGYPLSVVAGKAALLDEDYFISSTYGGDSVALAACRAVLDEMTDATLADLWESGSHFFRLLNELLEPIDVKIVGYGTRGDMQGQEFNVAVLMQELAKAGILIGRAWFYSVAHMSERVEEGALNVVSDVVERIKAGSVGLNGPPPEFIIRGNQ